jgi:hypothetical protein
MLVEAIRRTVPADHVPAGLLFNGSTSNSAAHGRRPNRTADAGIRAEAAA